MESKSKKHNSVKKQNHNLSQHKQLKHYKKEVKQEKGDDDPTAGDTFHDALTSESLTSSTTTQQ